MSRIGESRCDEPHAVMYATATLSQPPARIVECVGRSNFTLSVQFQGQPNPLVFPVRVEEAAIRSARQAVEAGAVEARVVRTSDNRVVYDQVWEGPSAA